LIFKFSKLKWKSICLSDENLSMTTRFCHVCLSKGRLLFPVGLLAALVFWTGGAGDGGAAGGGAIGEEVLTAGFGKGGTRNLGWRGSYRGVRPSKDSAVAPEEDKKDGGFKKPSLFRLWAHREDGAKKAVQVSEKEIVVKKSSARYAVDFNKSHSRWKYLSRSVRKQIDEASIARGRWRYLIIHNSATERGNASVFDYYHRNVKGMSNGLAYHFVIGNGSYSGDGEVEVGDRWLKQLAGGHVRSASQNEVAIGICLVGDFDRSRVNTAQLEALDELMDYLQGKVGVLSVATHGQINTRPTTCPGRYFPQAVIAKYEVPGKAGTDHLVLTEGGGEEYPLSASVERFDPVVSLVSGKGEHGALGWKDFAPGIPMDAPWLR
jgi:hypothetical protein